MTQAIATNQGSGQFSRLGTASVHIYAYPLRQHDEAVGGLVIVHDASYINTQSTRMWREAFGSVLVQVLLIALITLLIVRWSIVGPIAKAAQWMKTLGPEKVPCRSRAPDLDLLRPLAREMQTFAASLMAARSAAEAEAQHARDCGNHLDRGTSCRACAQQTWRQRPHRRFQPRTLFAYPKRRVSRSRRSSQRTGDGSGADSMCL